MFYFEEKKLGRWRPRWTPERPDARGADGVKREMRAVAEVMPQLRHLTLDQLREVYSPDGRFQNTGARQ